jgi:hypothetical protein
MVELEGQELLSSELYKQCWAAVSDSLGEVFKIKPVRNHPEFFISHYAPIQKVP